MGKDIEKMITDGEKKVADMEKRLDMLQKLFLRDGRIDDKEAEALKKTDDAIKALKKKVVDLKESKGEFDFSDDPMVVNVDTKKKYGEAKNFNDDYFKSRFNKSVKDWTQDGAIGLNSVLAYMIKQESPAGLTVMDLLPIITLVFPQSALLGAVVTLAPIVEKAFNDALKATGSKKPNVREIHESWVSSLNKLGSADLTKAYNTFVDEWKSRNGVDKGTDEAWTNLFGPACSGFAKDNMPKAPDVQKAFLGKLLRGVEDSYDIGGVEAGSADVKMMELARNWSHPGGQLDDVPEQLLQAIQTVYKRSPIIDLPVRIMVTVSNNMGATTCRIERSSRKSGDIGFRHVDGDKSIFEDFMKQKAYNKVNVSHLKVDG